VTTSERPAIESTTKPTIDHEGTVVNVSRVIERMTAKYGSIPAGD